MSPVPIVRGQAVVYAILLVIVAVVGAPREATAVAVGVGVFGLALRWKYVSDLRRSSVVEVPPHRDRLDLIVSGDLRGATLVGVAVGATIVFGGVDAPEGLGTVRSVGIALLAVVACMYLSSLVDWYGILPRISGLLGARPCRSHLGERPGVWPGTWRETTCWWYYHRILTAFVFRFGLGYAIALAISGVVSLSAERRIVVVGLLGVFAEYSPLKLRPLALEAMHPRLIVGDTVRRVRRGRTMRRQLKIGPFTFFAMDRKTPEEAEVHERDYVFDVSVEGVHFVHAALREADGPRENFENQPPLVRLQDIDDVDEGEPPFSGCDGGRCSGINWYCIENPRCFAKK